MKRQNSIRALRPGEPLPPGNPHRGFTKRGVILTWKVGPYTYVRVLEHRLVAGMPEGLVRHLNGDLYDNRPENLFVVPKGGMPPPPLRGRHPSQVRFASLRGVEATIVRRYQEGESCRSIAKDLSICEATVRRLLQAHGVPRRPAGCPPGGTNRIRAEREARRTANL